IYFHSIYNCSPFRLAGSSLRSKQASISFPVQTAHFTYHYISICIFLKLKGAIDQRILTLRNLTQVILCQKAVLL
ncbi:hypothetical protein BDZ91DRAFT_745719, partial [Kalaharituber pfeilii]